MNYKNKHHKFIISPFENKNKTFKCYKQPTSKMAVLERRWLSKRIYNLPKLTYIQKFKSTFINVATNTKMYKSKRKQLWMLTKLPKQKLQTMSNTLTKPQFCLLNSYKAKQFQEDLSGVYWYKQQLWFKSQTNLSTYELLNANSKFQENLLKNSVKKFHYFSIDSQFRETVQLLQTMFNSKNASARQQKNKKVIYKARYKYFIKQSRWHHTRTVVHILARVIQIRTLKNNMFRNRLFKELYFTLLMLEHSKLFFIITTLDKKVSNLERYLNN